MIKQDKCAARQESDQMRCPVCRTVWDTNDPEPPPCQRVVPVDNERKMVLMHDRQQGD